MKLEELRKRFLKPFTECPGCGKSRYVTIVSSRSSEVNLLCLRCDWGFGEYASRVNIDPDKHRRCLMCGQWCPIANLKENEPGRWYHRERCPDTKRNGAKKECVPFCTFDIVDTKKNVWECTKCGMNMPVPEGPK